MISNPFLPHSRFHRESVAYNCDTYTTPLPFGDDQARHMATEPLQPSHRLPAFLAADVNRLIRFVLIMQTQEGSRFIDLQEVVETIGRSIDNSIHIPDRYLSRHHAYLVRVPDPITDSYTYCLFDGDRNAHSLSANGVFVNSTQVRSHLLQTGDEIYFGPNVRAIFRPIFHEVAIPAASLSYR